MPEQQNIILWMVAHNLPLGHFKNYLEGGSMKKDASKGSSYSMKRPEEIARVIVNGLSQYPVAAQVAKEGTPSDPRFAWPSRHFAESRPTLGTSGRESLA